MTIVSGSQFFGGKPGQVVGRADAPKEQEEEGYLSRVFGGIKDTAMGVADDISGQAGKLGAMTEQDRQGLPGAVALARGGLRTVGGAARIAFTPLLEAPGIKQVGEKVAEKLAGTEIMQRYASWEQKHPEAAKDIQDVLDVVGLFGGKGAGELGTKGGGLLSEAAPNAVQWVKDGGKGAIRAAKSSPEEIMTRVARVTPTEQAAFKKISGGSIGEYLTKTGNFGTPEDIVIREAGKFLQSKSMVDDAFSKLPGEYRVGPIEDALKSVIRRGEKVSTPSAQADYLFRAKELLKKSASMGLNMEEINWVKRTLEREVRLGYNKLMNADAVERAKNVDKAIRNWQLDKAADLGFTNLSEMNKQTQIARFITDKLGKSIASKEALNNLSLTDWVILAGGDPTAIGGFLTKKFFSSKAIQAKVAKLLSGEAGEGIITPDVLNPRGLLEGPKGPIQAPSEGILRGQQALRELGSPTQRPRMSSPSYTQKVPIVDEGVEEVFVPSPKKTNLLNRAKKTGGEDPLLSEARKYKSAEEFVRAQQNPLAEKDTLYHGSPNQFDKFDLAKSRQENHIDGNGISFTEDPAKAGAYALDDDQASRYRRAIGSEELRNEGYVYSVKPNRPILSLDDTPTIKELNRIDKIVKKKLYSEEIPSWNEKMKSIKDGGTNADLHEAMQRHFGDSTNRVMGDLGYAGVKDGPHEIRIFDPKDIIIKGSKKVMSKSQLTDLYNRAVGEGK